MLTTSLVLVLWQNFRTPEKILERTLEHRHVVSDPQFRREMSVLLRPTIVRGNKIEQSLLDSMQAAGVQLHRYRPLHWYNLGRMNNRTHRKRRARWTRMCSLPRHPAGARAGT